MPCEERREARRLDDRLDLLRRGAGADRHRHPLRGEAHRVARVLGIVEPSATSAR